jgi:PAS domain S-box-containing protein
MPWAVTVLDSEGRVQFWNSAAQKLFDMEANSVVGLELSQLPIQPGLREALVRRRKSMEEGNTPTLLRNQELKLKRSTLKVDVHLTPLRHDGAKPSLLLMFAPQQSAANGKNSASGNSTRAKAGSARKKLAKRKK